jgi:hypothetical protein
LIPYFRSNNVFVSTVIIAKKKSIVNYMFCL